MQSGRQNVVGYYFDNKQSPGRSCHLSYSEQGLDLCGCCFTRLDSPVPSIGGWRWVGKLRYKTGRTLNSSLPTAENTWLIVVCGRLKRHGATMIPLRSICIYPIPFLAYYHHVIRKCLDWSLGLKKMLLHLLGTVFGGKTDLKVMQKSWEWRPDGMLEDIIVIGTFTQERWGWVD